MTVRYYCLLGEVTFEEAKILRITEGATTSSATIAAGTYYLRGDGASGDLCLALKTALEAAGAPTNTYTVVLSNNVITIDDNSPTFKVTITRATGTDSFSLLWANGSTTLTAGLFGFAASDTAHNASAKSGTLAPTCAWAADQAPASDDPSDDALQTQRVMTAGQVRTFERGGPYASRAVGFDFVDPSRTLATASYASSQGAFRTFWSTHRDGRRMELHNPAASTATAVAAFPSLLGIYVFDEETCGAFKPNRKEPGLELYSWSIGLRGYIS